MVNDKDDLEKRRQEAAARARLKQEAEQAERDRKEKEFQRRQAEAEKREQARQVEAEKRRRREEEQARLADEERRRIEAEAAALEAVEAERRRLEEEAADVERRREDFAKLDPSWRCETPPAARRRSAERRLRRAEAAERCELEAAKAAVEEELAAERREARLVGVAAPLQAWRDGGAATMACSSARSFSREAFSIADPRTLAAGLRFSLRDVLSSTDGGPVPSSTDAHGRPCSKSPRRRIRRREHDETAPRWADHVAAGGPTGTSACFFFQQLFGLRRR